MILNPSPHPLSLTPSICLSVSHSIHLCVSPHPFLCPRLSVWLYLHLTTCLSPPVSLFLSPSVCLSLSPPVCLSVSLYLSVSLPACLSVSYFMEGRDPAQLIYRWNNVLDPSLKKGPWRPEEDQVRGPATFFRPVVVLLSWSMYCHMLTCRPEWSVWMQMSKDDLSEKYIRYLVIFWN